jgi:peptidylprolyl isomerase
MKTALAALPLLALAVSAHAQDSAEPPTPNSIVAAAPAEAWKPIDPADLLVMDLAPDRDGTARRVIIQLVPRPFSTGWTGNIRTLAREHWWDGTSVYRVADNWVAQWGDADEGKELPEGLRSMSPDEFVTRVERDPEGIRDYVLTPAREEIVISRFIDSYAIPGFVAGWPVGLDQESGETAWPVHCYGTVGVARSVEHMGSGGDLYAVIGHAPRQLDRIIAVVGRVIEGIEHLSSLPRGHGELGFYADDEVDLRTPIVSVRLGNELAEVPPPRFEYLDTASESFAAYMKVRASRSDSFYIAPAMGVDLCNVQVPVRRVPSD